MFPDSKSFVGWFAPKIGGGYTLQGTNMFNTWGKGKSSLKVLRYGDMLLGGGFKYFSFSPLLGEDSHFD